MYVFYTSYWKAIWFITTIIRDDSIIINIKPICISVYLIVTWSRPVLSSQWLFVFVSKENTRIWKCKNFYKCRTRRNTISTRTPINTITCRFPLIFCGNMISWITNSLSTQFPITISSCEYPTIFGNSPLKITSIRFNSSTWDRSSNITCRPDLSIW